MDPYSILRLTPETPQQIQQNVTSQTRISAPHPTSVILTFRQLYYPSPSRTMPGAWYDHYSLPAPSPILQPDDLKLNSASSNSPAIDKTQAKPSCAGTPPRTPTNLKGHALLRNSSQEDSTTSTESIPPFLLCQQDSPMSRSRTMSLTKLMPRPKKLTKEPSRDNEGWDILDVRIELPGPVEGIQRLDRACVLRSSTLDEYEFIVTPSDVEV